MNVWRDLGRWLWRLLPANPILVRVVAAGGKRSRHLWARFAYLVTLFVVILAAGGGGFGAQSASLAELAKQASNTFMWVSIVQLCLMSFIAPVFTAGAITQEKDANTFHILLTTPLSNAQIVFGSLFSRLYFIWALLLASIPIFCITMLYGGVTSTEVFLSVALAAATGLLTGALAITISVIRVGTRRTIFSFFFGIATYLLALGAYGLSHYGWLPEAPFEPGQTWQMSWLAPLHPFLALLVVTGQTPPPPSSDVYHYGWPWRWLLAYPQYGYLVLTSLASIALVLFSLFFVRRGAREGERSWLNRCTAFFSRPAANGERRRPPRRVWKNPIAWREAATRASTAGRSAMRWLFIIGGAAAGILLLVAHEKGWAGLNANKPALTRDWLTAITWIELAVILLVVTNTAATTLTREKESRTLELLLTTPLTSHYIIAGMLRGLVSFVIPLIAVPAFTIALFVLADFRHTPARHVTTPETLLLVPLVMTAFAALAAMVGLQFSLTSRRTVQAVMISTAVVLGGSGLLAGCALAMTQAGSTVAAIIQPFTPFHAVQSLIDYQALCRDLTNPPTPAQQASARFLRSIASVIAVCIYAAVTYSLYKNLVRNFDMTIRRQSA